MTKVKCSTSTLRSRLMLGLVFIKGVEKNLPTKKNKKKTIENTKPGQKNQF